MTTLVKQLLTEAIAGWSSLVARRAHNPKVVGSNPAPATNKALVVNHQGFSIFGIPVRFYGSTVLLGSWWVISKSHLSTSIVNHTQTFHFLHNPPSYFLDEFPQR